MSRAHGSPALSLNPTATEPATGFWLLVGMILLVAVGKPILCDTMDPDCFWHLRVAEQLRSQIELGRLGPLVDHLSFASMPDPWTPYSWLAELGMDGLWRTLGWRGAVLAHVLMSGAFIALIALACRARPSVVARASSPCLDRQEKARVGNPCHENLFTAIPTIPGALPSALATAAAAFLSLQYISFRPVTAALVLLAFCCWLIVRDRRSAERTRAVWCLIPITALVVNLHLYAIFIPMWVATLWLGSLWERYRAIPENVPEANRRLTRYGWLLAATSIACLATPMLRGVIGAIFHYQSHDPMVASGEIAEMRPFYTGATGPFSAAIVLSMLGCAIRRRQMLRPGEWIWFATSLALLFRLGRFAPPFAIVAAPIFALTMPRLSSRVLNKRPVEAVMAIVLLIGVARIGLSFPRANMTLDKWLQRQGPDIATYPCGAADYVQANIHPTTGKLINEFTWGGYLQWRFAGRYQTLLDGRTQLFSPEFWHATYLGTEQDRADYLSKIHADAAILPIKNSKFEKVLEQQGWQIAYRDPWATVLIPPPQGSANDQPMVPFTSAWFGD